MEITKHYKLSVFVVGIRKRCRKEERHLLSGGYLPLEVDHSLAKQLARNLVMREMRTVTRPAYAVLNYVETRNEDTGFRVEEWKPFDERHVRIELGDDQ